MSAEHTLRHPEGEDQDGQGLEQALASHDPRVLRLELNAREAERQRLEEQLWVALEERKKLNREVEEARDLLIKLRRTLEDQEAALETARQARRRIERSLSWKLTRPVRGVGNVARRILRRPAQHPRLPA